MISYHIIFVKITTIYNYIDVCETTKKEGRRGRKRGRRELEESREEETIELPLDVDENQGSISFYRQQHLHVPSPEVSEQPATAI